MKKFIVVDREVWILEQAYCRKSRTDLPTIRKPGGSQDCWLYARDRAYVSRVEPTHQ